MEKQWRKYIQNIYGLEIAFENLKFSENNQPQLIGIENKKGKANCYEVEK